MSAHLVPGAVFEDLEDKLLLREGLLHCVYGNLVRALCRDLRPLLLTGESLTSIMDQDFRLAIMRIKKYEFEDLKITTFTF